jgi:inosine/xanthosine triphosphatase
MKILLGSTSEQKINVIRRVFAQEMNIVIIPCKVESGVADQPLDFETTKNGAINRARNALKSHKLNDEDFAIGLEGGLEKIDGLFNLVCVAVIMNRTGKISIGKSELLPLPRIVSDRVASGEQFGVVIREFDKSLNKEFDPEICSQVVELISREKSFVVAIRMAYKFFANIASLPI